MNTTPRRLAFLLAALSALGPFSIDTYLPAFPAIAQALGTSDVHVQQTLTAYLLPFAFMMLWHGAISDALGRRRMILAGLILFALASLICAAATRIEMLWLGRALQGMSSGIGIVVGRAMVRDLEEGPAAQRLMAQVAVLFAIAPAIAPIIGGWILRFFDWHGVFVFLALLALLLLIACALWLPETLLPSRRQPLVAAPLARAYGRMFSHPRFLALSLANALNFNAFFVYVLSAPVFLMRHLGLSAQSFAVLFVPQVSGMMLGSILSGRLAGRRSPGRTVALAYGLMASAALLNLTLNLIRPPTLPWSIVPLPLFSCGMALAMPSLQLLALDIFPTRRGLASSGLGVIQTSVGAFSSALVVPLLWASTLGLAGGMAGFLLLGAAAYGLARRAARTPSSLPGTTAR